MPVRILFITSRYFYPLTRDALGRMELSCEVTVAAYDDFSQIPHIYDQYKEECDAVFISGVSAQRVLELERPGIRQTITAFQVDSDALHRDVLRFAVENQSLNFSRVAMDFLLPLGKGYSVTDFLDIEDIRTVFTRNQDWMQDTAVRRHGAESWILHRIVELWERGEIDCVICMYSGNVPKLQKLGIPCRCPFLSDAHLKRLIKDTLIKIELQHLHDNHPSIVQIFPPDNLPMTEERGQQLENAIREYFRTNLIECVIQRSDACCTVVTSLQVARFLTGGFTCCGLCGHLEQVLEFPVVSAYGTGTTISHAMNNVQLASREAKLAGKPFAVESNGHLIGPLSGDVQTVITQGDRMEISDIARKASLSVMTIRKLMTVLRNRGSDKLTTQELAQSLDTTIRNANRIMQNLLRAELAVPVYTQITHSRGRPVQVYSLNLSVKF